MQIADFTDFVISRFNCTVNSAQHADFECIAKTHVSDENTRANFFCFFVSRELFSNLACHDPHPCSAGANLEIRSDCVAHSRQV